MNTDELPPARDPAEWRPDDLSRSEAWRHTFTQSQRSELSNAAKEPAATSAAPDEKQLPLLASEIEKTRHELRSGLGFRILHDFPIEGLGNEGAARAFTALSRQLGEPMKQRGGVQLAHVRLDARGRKRFGFRTAGELPFHADLEDVTGFLCLRPASRGGVRKFVSSVTVYNVMRQACPDHLQTLTRAFHMELRHPHPDHGGAWTLLPFVSMRDGVFNACAFRVHIKQAQMLPGVPELSGAQSEALDAFNAIADDVAVSVELQPGDVEYYNNHVVLHTRTRFVDDQEPGRHLLRVWLAMTDFRVLHDQHPITLRDRMKGRNATV